MALIHMILGLFLITIAICSQIQAVRYQVTVDDIGTPGSTRFMKQIGVPYTLQAIQLAPEFIWHSFEQSEHNRRNVELVSVIVKIIGGFAGLTENNNSTIFMNSDYMEKINGDVRKEFTVLLYHEATHVWQCHGNGQAPMGLTEGIVDYIRLKAGHASPHWAPRGTGDRWDQGYAVTAYFLDYCDGLRDGFVAELNNMMRDHYSDDFFGHLLGKNVGKLWKDCKSHFGN